MISPFAVFSPLPQSGRKSRQFNLRFSGLKPNAQRLQQDVITLSGLPRGSYDVQGLEKTARYIREEFEKMGFTVTEQPVPFRKKTGYRNLLVSYGPPEAEAIVIGAHYDTKHGYSGADDNASGVAGLLELGRLLQENQPKLAKRIILAAYPLEEVFLNGSRTHAKSLNHPSAKIKGMISLEMIGYYRDEPNTQRFPAPFMKYFYPTVGNFIAVVGDIFSNSWIKAIKQGLTKNSSIPVETLAAPPILTTVFRSDHASFRLHGLVPACMITDTANMRNPNYHKKTDTPETLNYPRMAELIQGLYGFLTQQP